MSNLVVVLLVLERAAKDFGLGCGRVFVIVYCAGFGLLKFYRPPGCAVEAWKRRDEH